MNAADQPLPTDTELLSAFVATRSEAAFAELLKRHEALVLGVCLRLLERADAEDAAQAVFLTLAHKAPSLQREGSLAGWLHRVAWQVALNSRKSDAARQRREREANMVKAPSTGTEHAEWQQVREVLDREVAALPARYRQPLLLHYFSQLTQEQTAAALGEKTGTISMRLNRARELLRARLSAHGVSLSSLAVVELIARHAAVSHLSGATAGATIKAAQLIAAGSEAAAGAVVSSKAAALARQALTALWVAQLKVAALLVFAVLLLGAAAGHGHFTTHAEEQPPVPPPAPVVRATTPAAFVPKGGKLSAPIPIAKRFPWAHSLEWNFDGTKLLGTIDHRWKENRGGLSREGPDEVDSYTIDLATNTVTKLFENQGTPKWLAGDRLFVVLDGKATIVEPTGERHELATKKYVYPAVSHDGKYVAYFSINENENRFLQPLMLYSVLERSITELHPPAEEPPTPDAQFQQHLGFWNDENRLCVRTGWNDGTADDLKRVKVSFYTPATKSYAHAEYYGSDWSFQQYTGGRDRMMLTGGTWLMLEGPADWKEPPRESAPNGPRAPRGEGKGGDGNEPRPAKPAVALSFHDESGKELHRVPLDTDAINHGALQVHAVSSDQKFMVASGYRNESPHPGLPVTLEKTYVIDLANGKVIATLNTGDLDIRTSHPIAIFSPTRQVLAITRPKMGHEGIYAFGFDDKPPRELAAGKGLPNFLVDGDNSVWPDYISRLTGAQRRDWDHMTVVADPLNFANVLDPKYESEPHQLFVFWNSATPIRVFASDSRTNRPTNVTWSRDGKKLAFISGANVYIWEPQADGAEFQMPKAASTEDF